MKNNYILTNKEGVEDYFSTISMMCRSMGWSYEYLIKRLRGLCNGDKINYKGYIINVLKESKNKPRGISLNNK